MKHSRPQIMAIINTSPDSFAGDGLDAADDSRAKAYIQKALADGADILDIGGQSTRPGAEIIPVDQEIDRVVPAILLARSLTDKPISIDTFKPAVARAAVAVGASMINDVRGASDPDMVTAARESGCSIVIMHSRGDPKTMGSLTGYPNGVVAEVGSFLQKRAQELIDNGIAKEHIIVDPGIGFAKTAAQSMELTAALGEITALGYPVLYGASQKSFLGKILGSENDPLPLEKRIEATMLVQAYAMLQKAAIIRAHDVKHAVQTRTIIEEARRAHA